MNVFVDQAVAADRRAGKLVNQQSAQLQKQEAVSKVEDNFDAMRADGLDDGEVQTLLAQLESLGMDTSAIRKTHQSGGDVEKQFQRSVDRFSSSLKPSAADEIKLQQAVHGSNLAWKTASDASAQRHKIAMSIIGNMKA